MGVVFGGKERRLGEVLILLGRKLGQLIPRSTRVAFKRAVVGGEGGLQVKLGKGLVLCLCSQKSCTEEGKAS